MDLDLRPLGPDGGGFLYALPDGRRLRARITGATLDADAVSLFLLEDPIDRVLGAVAVPSGPGVDSDPSVPARLLPALRRALGPGARRLLRAIAARARAHAAAEGGFPAPFHFGRIASGHAQPPSLLATTGGVALVLPETPAVHAALLHALEAIRVPLAQGLRTGLSTEVLLPHETSAHDRLRQAPDLHALAAALEAPDPLEALQRLHDAWTLAATDEA